MHQNGLQNSDVSLQTIQFSGISTLFASFVQLSEKVTEEFWQEFWGARGQKTHTHRSERRKIGNHWYKILNEKLLWLPNCEQMEIK